MRRDKWPRSRVHTYASAGRTVTVSQFSSEIYVVMDATDRTMFPSE
jgi:hypothetical protein